MSLALDQSDLSHAVVQYTRRQRACKQSSDFSMSMTYCIIEPSVNFGSVGTYEKIVTIVSHSPVLVDSVSSLHRYSRPLS